MKNAELTDKEFTAEKQNTIVINTTSYQSQRNESDEPVFRKDWNIIPVPRRYLSKILTTY